MTKPPAPSFPAHRANLVMRAVGGNGEYVIKNPSCGDYYQMGEEEHFLLTQLDGRKSPEAVCSAYTQRFERPLSREELDEFVNVAGSRGLLHEEQPPSMHPGAAQRRAGSDGRQSPLHWRKCLCDPDRFFTWLTPKLSFFWTRTFLLLSGGCILLAVLVFWANHHEVLTSFGRVLRWETAVWAWLALAAVIALHESAHGLTCKRHGGEVREIGFLLIYFQPAFYCNVSDAWLFPEKAKRLWVTFAGAYIELFLWALATLTWRLTEPGTGLNYLALVLMVTTGVTSLFNLNPLIKLDGYYLLSDYLEIPNLRERAFSYLGSRWLGRPQSDPAGTDIPARERRVYWTYGLLAWAYSLGLLGAVIVSSARFLTQRYQAWGFLLFSALLLSACRGPLRRALHFVTSPLLVPDGIRRWITRLKRLAKIAVALAVVSAALCFIQTELRISGEFKILPIRNADIRAEVEGILEEIPKDEGEQVNAGEWIARLSDRDLRAEMRKVMAQIGEKEAQLRMLKAGARAEAIELARTSVAKAEQRLKYAKSYLAIDKGLFDQKLSSLREFEMTEEMTVVREKELDEAHGNLKVILAGSRPEEIEALQAEINRLCAQQDHLEAQLRLLRVPSPIAGVIITHKLREKIGGSVRKGDLIAAVQDVKTVTAEIAIPEKEISDVKLGQRVVLRVRAFPQTGFDGKVTRIAPIVTGSAENPGGGMVLVVTQLENPDLLLKPDMSGNAKIHCGSRRLLDVVTRRAARYIRVEFWSWW